MIPDGWTYATIESVCAKVTSGGTPSRKRPEFYGGEIPWVKTRELQDGWVRRTEEHLTQVGLDSSSAKLLPANTILMAMYGATVGKLGLLADEMTCNQAACALIVDPKVASFRFLFYRLLLERSAITTLATGAAQQNLNAGTIRSAQLLFPPLEEQERIAGVLGAFDDLIETNRRLARHTTDLQRAAFLRATDGLPRVAISEVMQVEMGQSPPGHTYNSDADGLPFFQGVKDFGDRYPATRVYCCEPRRIAEPGDLLLAVRAPIGRVNVATERCATGRGLAILRSAIPAVAFQAVTAQPDLWAAYEDEGTVFSSINRRVISEQRIRWSNDPSLADALEALDRLVLDCYEQSVALSRQRDELLPLLMSGKVRVRDVETSIS